jgi:hypothetical protein
LPGERYQPRTGTRSKPHIRYTVRVSHHRNSVIMSVPTVGVADHAASRHMIASRSGHFAKPLQGDERISIGSWPLAPAREHPDVACFAMHMQALTSNALTDCRLQTEPTSTASLDLLREPAKGTRQTLLCAGVTPTSGAIVLLPFNSHAPCRAVRGSLYVCSRGRHGRPTCMPASGGEGWWLESVQLLYSYPPS